MNESYAVYMAESLRDVSYQATNSPDPAYTQLLGALCKA